MSHADPALAPAPPRRRIITNPHSDQVRFIPRALLRAIGGLVGLTTLLVALAVFTGQPPAAKYPDDLAVVQERALVLIPRADGGIRVEDADGALRAELGPEAVGFVGGLQRALARVRMLADVPADAPVRLVRWAD
ncbi:MAG: photosynthetic complex assembly protein PuhC, partial [Pseudomonadota bacterium]